MTKRLLTTAAAVTVLAAFAQTAAAAPTPDYAVTCAVGGQTTVTWNHAKLASVTFDWGTTGAPLRVPVSAHPPHGSILTVTPAGAASVTVTFQRVGSTGDPVTAGCS